MYRVLRRLCQRKGVDAEMLKMDDIKGRTVEACRRGKAAVENTFVRRHSIPGGAALARDCARAMATLFSADGYVVQSFEVADFRYPAC